MPQQQPQDGTYVRLEDLVSQVDIARILHVAPNTVRAWANGERGADFPQPLLTVGKRTQLWNIIDVLHWHAQYVPNRGGAPRGERNGMTKKTKSGWYNG